MPSRETRGTTNNSCSDPAGWVDTIDRKQVGSSSVVILIRLQLPKQYDSLLQILSSVQNEILKRQHRSDTISCTSFLPVVQSFVTPSKDLRRSSHFRSHSKQRKSTSVSTPKSPIYSDASFDDSVMSSTNLSAPYIKMEPVFQTYSVPSKSYSSEYSVSVKSEPFSVKQEESTSQFNELKSPSQVSMVLAINEQNQEEPSELETVTPYVSSPSSESGVSSQPLSVSPSFLCHSQLDSYVDVSPPQIYRQALEVILTVASMGQHTERQLIQCCEEYLKQYPLSKSITAHVSMCSKYYLDSSSSPSTLSCITLSRHSHSLFLFFLFVLFICLSLSISS